MSQDFKPPATSGSDMLMETIPAPTSPDDSSHLAHSALAYVVSHSQAMDNLEPSLAALSDPLHHPSHPTVTSSQVEQNSLSLASAVDIATSSLAAHGLANSSETPKAKRLNRACDACSRRKVKCDHERPCKNCRDLNIECTFNRPTKRRGPINKVAEELKRQKRVHHPNNDQNEISSLAEHTTGNLSLLFHTTHDDHTAESIAPFDVVKRLVMLYFTYVYPRFPFPHEDLFVECLNKRLDLEEDKDYTALLAAVVGVTAAFVPRLARVVLLELGDESLLANNLTPFIQRCVKMATDIRGGGFQMREAYSVHDANTSFLLGLIGGMRHKWTQFRFCMAESLNILQWLNLQKKEGVTPQNYVDSELAARLYAAIYVQMRSTANLGSLYSLAVTPIPPPSPTSLPESVDDYCVYYDHIEEQTDIPSLVGGSNVITNIYIAANPRDRTMGAKIELENTNQAFRNGPDELLAPFGPEIALDVFMDVKDRRQIQIELLKATIRISWLTCRAVILHRHESDDASLTSEWAELVSDTATFLKSLPNAYVEPQAESTLHQLKVLADFAIAGITHDTEGHSAGYASEAAAEDVAYVAMRVAQLEQEVLLENSGGMVTSLVNQENGLEMTEEDEEPRL